ncbi:site-specific DNA-methyltransferase [Gallibacterium anatis]|uniref:site-specific DNA-methyltransferase n=2 Tax=Gallibacterium anatis TaxID=750 RepID=UPI000AE5413F|nr:site-specific DNA-methyltransferase [Gallibacterium anatis]
MNNIEKLKMHSPNLTDKNIAKIAEIFPNCTTEILDENGKPKIAIDFDLLQQELSGSLVGGGVERYQLNWPGKREALLTANAPIAKTLRPVREESVHFDSTENLFIEGDNLDALKLLQETYLGKVKMIYIDPPYNTGKDFVYADDFAENTEDYLRRSNQKDEDGNRMEVNSESNGRFHSDWLSMMYPRLKLARNLLTDDGVIFISIDDNEQANLKRLCDEVFGEQNFVADLVWYLGTGTQAGHFTRAHENILCYFKNKDLVPNFSGGEGIIEHSALKKISVKNPESEFLFPAGTRWDAEDGTELTGEWGGSEKMKLVSGKMIAKDGKLLNDVVLSAGYAQKEQMKSWFSGNETFDSKGQKVVSFYFNKNGILRYEKERSVINPPTVLSNLGSTKNGSDEIISLLSEKVFDFPKPIKLITFLTALSTNPGSNDLILDFFAGSGSTAHAVMQLNAEDGGNRRYICVQLPEDLDKALKTADTNAKKTIQNAIEWLDVRNKPHTIAEITKERIRRAADKIRSDFADKLPENWDGGFRVLKTDTSNMADVYYTPEETLKKMQQSQQDWLNQVSDNIKPDRTPEDLLFQVMLDWGVDLALPIEVKQIMGRTVFFVDGNTLIACFDKQAVDNDFITALTKYRPLRAIFRDDSFKDDAAKINAGQIFQQYSESTEVKTI